VFAKDPFATTRSQAAMALAALGRSDEALEVNASGIRHLEAYPHPFSEGWVRLGHAIVHILRREVDEARAEAEAALAQATIEGFPQWVAQAQVYRGWARVWQGEHADGLQEIRDGLALWRLSGAQLLLPWQLSVFGDACLRAGRPQDAIEALTEGLELAVGNGDRWCEPELLGLLGAAELAAGHPREPATERIRLAAALARERGHLGLAQRAEAHLHERAVD
jgi:tetratricopeptide (TPR) repeat protein